MLIGSETLARPFLLIWVSFGQFKEPYISVSAAELQRCNSEELCVPGCSAQPRWGSVLAQGLQGWAGLVTQTKLSCLKERVCKEERWAEVAGCEKATGMVEFW